MRLRLVVCYQAIGVDDSERMVVAHLVTVTKLFCVRKTQRENLSAAPPRQGRGRLRPGMDSGTRTLHQRVERVHRRQVGCYGNVLIPPRCLDVHGDGPGRHVVVETGDHPSGEGHVGQAALAVITGGREGEHKVGRSPGNRVKNKAPGYKNGLLRKENIKKELEIPVGSLVEGSPAYLDAFGCHQTTVAMVTYQDQLLALSSEALEVPVGPDGQPDDLTRAHTHSRGEEPYTYKGSLILGQHVLVNIFETVFGYLDEYLATVQLHNYIAQTLTLHLQMRGQNLFTCT